MNKKFVRDYYQFINKMLPELEMNINQDNGAKIRKMLFDLEIQFVLFKEQLMKALREL